MLPNLASDHCIYLHLLASALSPHTQTNKMQSRLGMNQTLASQQTSTGGVRKRPAAQSAPKRTGDVWDSVRIVKAL